MAKHPPFYHGCGQSPKSLRRTTAPRGGESRGRAEGRRRGRRSRELDHLDLVVALVLEVRRHEPGQGRGAAVAAENDLAVVGIEDLRLGMTEVDRGAGALHWSSPETLDWLDTVLADGPKPI